MRPDGLWLSLRSNGSCSKRSTHVILSYSSGGRATATELHNVINSNGKLNRSCRSQLPAQCHGGMRWTHEWTRDAEQPTESSCF